MSRAREEQETVIRYDRASGDALLWTANPYDAAKWRKKGYPVQEDGASWRCSVPKGQITYRTRKGHSTSVTPEISGVNGSTPLGGGPVAVRVSRFQKPAIPRG